MVNTTIKKFGGVFDIWFLVIVTAVLNFRAKAQILKVVKNKINCILCLMIFFDISLFTEAYFRSII